MAIFEYIAKKTDGTNITGVIEADSKEEVLVLLESKQLFPIEVQVRKKDLLADIQLKLMNRVKTKDLVIFSRQLAVMMSASLPLVQALRIVVKQTTNDYLNRIISNVADEVDGGAKLSQAMERYPKVFSNFFTAMIRSGETSGRLDDVLNYLADQQEKDYALMSKIRGAMIYPSFIVGGLVVVGVIMMIFVVPRLTSILIETGAELPLSTKIVIAVSDFLSNSWWLLIVLIGIAFVGLKLLQRSSGGQRWWDTLKIKLPIFGKLFLHIYLVRMTRSLSTLIRGGVPLPQALIITSDVVTNAAYRELIMVTKKEVDDGNPLSTIFLESKLVPQMASQMINVGEQTGQLEKILDKLTDFYSRNVENLVGNLVSLIEPMIMVVLGVAVGGMVASIILPMYNLASSI